MLLKSISLKPFPGTVSCSDVTKHSDGVIWINTIRYRRMDGFEGQWRWTHHFLLVNWVLLVAAAPPTALGYFLGDTKAVLNGCDDYWTLQDRAAMPLLFQMTVCVDIRVVVPGAWVAFSYSSVHAPRPELGLEGDDGALYGWLLRVRHRFPLQLSPTHWHRVCLRRDVPHNSFSLEVDGEIVAERTVIAHAIPPSGSLWLGCHPRDRPPGVKLGEVELYMFRMWADLGDHGLCEDGNVIGWNARYWGVTSPKARQRDPHLLCDHRRLRREAVVSTVSSAITTLIGRQYLPSTDVPLATTTSSPVTATPDSHMSNPTTMATSSPLLNCNINQLCSNTDTYFWMFLSVDAKVSNNIANDVKDLLSYAVSVCDLQLAGVSALQQAGDENIQARIIGEVARVGRNLCKDPQSPRDKFVKCTSTSSLDDICQANTHSEVTCSILDLNYSNLAPQPVTESCSSQFYAVGIKINTASVDVNILKTLAAHLECRGTQQR
ncbi:uncharacterized protein LOC121200796 [Toxotes jaculatrix]|uniref:uncharacterized protein LOC121200796 n=1 Tax=Toxotes jaculatrix TaxID=941984 RepID=UPI001B3A97A5|nr:uncharacterized protein LOC121200796 [Toxotes jaculatrix]